jgi:hypothetical protein
MAGNRPKLPSSQGGAGFHKLHTTRPCEGTASGASSRFAVIVHSVPDHAVLIRRYKLGLVRRAMLTYRTRKEILSRLALNG